MNSLKLFKLLFVLVLSSVVLGQDDSTMYTLSGLVYDSRTDTPLSGVNIYLTDMPLGASTDEDGFFLF